MSVDVVQARPRRVRPLAMLGSAGALLFLVSILVSPERAWASWLAAASTFFSVAAAGPFFLALFALVGARWSEPLRLELEQLARALPIGSAALLFSLFGASSLFDWAHAHAGDAHDPTHGGWLGIGAVAARQIFVQAALIWLSRGLADASERRRNGLETREREARRAAVFMPCFAVLVSLTAFDWLMSVDPHWFSTMFGVYLFAGILLGGVAMITIAALARERSGVRLPDGAVHDLGKLLFAFAFFWGYIWFCQYLLIWYSNIPEETVWFETRLRDGYATLTLLSLALNFAIPFVALLSAEMKKRRAVLLRIAGIVLVGRVLDFSLMVTPAVVDAPSLTVWEIGPPLAAAAVLFLVLDSRRNG